MGGDWARPEPLPAPRASSPGFLSPEEEEARWKAVEEKLEEYLQWGMRLMETHATHLRRIAPGHLLTEHPLREKSLDALVRATLAWAYSGHVELWARSAKHPSGKTHLTEPLLSILQRLESGGKASVRYFP